MNWLHITWRWLDARLKVQESVLPMLTHPIPRGAAGPMGWWYVFGSASLTLLLIQILTGIGLALVYVPAADKAYESLLSLNYEQPLGWFLRALHYYAGSGMVVMVFLHMTQVFLHGAYKYPRELTWLIGVFLLLCTLGMFFTGQVLRWDPDAYWGLAVGGSMAGRVPFLGPQIVDLLLGGPIIGGNSLSRFFTLHVFVIPGALLTLLAIHLWLVLKCGISAPPVPGHTVNPETYDTEYHNLQLVLFGQFPGGLQLGESGVMIRLGLPIAILGQAIVQPKDHGALLDRLVFRSHDINDPAGLQRKQRGAMNSG
jgi:ubiquinol-cytochrome c reductase cytochrome b subunit